MSDGMSLIDLPSPLKAYSHVQKPEKAIEHPEMDLPGFTGIIHDLSNERYHSHHSASKSFLDNFSVSEAQALAAKQGLLRKETKAFVKGTLGHCALLEPGYLDFRYLAFPDEIDLRTKTGKARYAEFEHEANGRILVRNSEMHMAKRMRDQVQKHKIASALLSDGESEVSIFSEINGMPVRCRPDYLNGTIIVDVKTTISASESEFTKSVFKYRYYVQDPFYTDIAESRDVDIDEFVFVVIEKTEPFHIGIYRIPEEYKELGRREYIANLDTLKRCQDSGVWPGYPERIIDIYPKPFQINEIERRIDNAT